MAAGPPYACPRASGINLKYKGYIDHYLIAIYNTSHYVRITFPCVVFRIGEIISHWWFHMINTLRPRQNGGQFSDDIFKFIFLNKNILIVIEIPLTFVLSGPINNIQALVQIMACLDNPLSKPMMVS